MFIHSPQFSSHIVGCFFGDSQVKCEACLSPAAGHSNQGWDLHEDYSTTHSSSLILMNYSSLCIWESCSCTKDGTRQGISEHAGSFLQPHSDL